MMYLVMVQIVSQWVAIGYLAYQSKLMKHNVELSEIAEYRSRPVDLYYSEEDYARD